MFVFTLQHCVSLKCDIRTYTPENKLYSEFPLEDIHLDIHSTQKHIELQRAV